MSTLIMSLIIKVDPWHNLFFFFLKLAILISDIKNNASIFNWIVAGECINI